MTIPGHEHAGFELPPGQLDPLGRPVNHDLLGRFTGAAFDGCAPCQDALMAQMIQDPATTTRLVELACVATAGVLRGIPPSMTDPDAPGVASQEFRRLARAGADGAMLAACEGMTPEQRRAAASTAADILIGHLMLGGPAQ
jgi:hypothetical protein